MLEFVGNGYVKLINQCSCKEIGKQLENLPVSGNAFKSLVLNAFQAFFFALVEVLRWKTDGLKKNCMLLFVSTLMYSLSVAFSQLRPVCHIFWSE